MSFSSRKNLQIDFATNAFEKSPFLTLFSIYLFLFIYLIGSSKLVLNLVSINFSLLFYKVFQNIFLLF